MVYTPHFRPGAAPPLKKSLLQNWPLYASATFFLLLIWIILGRSITRNHGFLVYASDDPYIHMAMAKNFSQFEVWGVTRFEYASTSSSPLWTLLISTTYYLTGVNTIAPLLWNLIFALVILVIANEILTWYKSPPAIRFTVLMGIVLLVPLPMFLFTGMETGLQTLIAIPFVFLAARCLSGESPSLARRDSIVLLILAPLVTAVRFEGMFMIAVVAGLSLLLKRWRLAAALTVCGFLPVLINGMISVWHGWFWFPNSVLLKATLPDLHASRMAFVVSLLDPFLTNLRKSPHLLTLLIAILLLYLLAQAKGNGWRESRQLMTAILFPIGIAHLEFVGATGMYRYDAFWCALAILLLGLQLPVVAPRMPSLRSPLTWTMPNHLACGALLLLILLPNLEKGWRDIWFLPQCTHNVYEQQYQMGLFVRRYYQNSSVALNDIGAVNFLADIHCLDLYGLATAQVAAARLTNGYGRDEVERVSRRSGARIAIIYDYWFDGLIPAGWIRVGRWSIQDNVILGGPTVSFYALSEGEVSYLRQSLADFSSHLPVDVIQQGP